METPREYSYWEGLVINALASLLDSDTSDAQGFLDAHSFEASQAWGRDYTPLQAAEYIISKQTQND